MRSDDKPLIIALLVVQAAISASLWTLNSISVDSTAAFAILLAADVLIFAGICHLAFFSGEEEAESAMPWTPPGAMADEAPAHAEAHHEEVHAPQPLVDLPTVLSRNIRFGVPIVTAAVLLLLAVLVASGKGVTDIFVPIYIFLVVVYVFSAIYFFKALMDREKVTAAPAEAKTSSEEQHH